MLKQSGCLLLISVLSCTAFSTTNLATRTNEGQSDVAILDEMVVTLMKTCVVGLKNIAVYDDTTHSSIFHALSTTKPLIPVTLLSTTSKNPTNGQLDKIGIQAMVLIINVNQSWESVIMNILDYWRFNNNSTIIIVLKSNDASAKVLDILAMLSQFTVYYVCINNQSPVIYTHDPHGDSHPPFWQMVWKERPINYNQFTLYRRSYHKNTSCEGLHFNRVNPIKHSNIVIGITGALEITSENPQIVDGVYNDTVLEILPEQRENILALKLALQANFTYIVRSDPSELDDTYVDVVTTKYTDWINESSWMTSYPVEEINLKILSHHRGYLTSIQKLGKYYGYWTLVFLVTVMLMIFLALWLANPAHVAFFDALRFLVKTRHYSRIDTIYLRVFFVAVFFYFLVMHAAIRSYSMKYLTRREPCKNIDSVEDLTDTQIKVIYHYGPRIPELEANKEVIPVSHDGECSSAVIQNPNAICVGPVHSHLNMISEYRQPFKYYVSKQSLAKFSTSWLYRKRFPLEENFNRAMMIMQQSGVLNRAIIISQETTLMRIRWAEGKLMKNRRAISFENFDFAFALLAAGNSLGFIMFLFEKLIYPLLIIRLRRKGRSKRYLYELPTFNEKEVVQ